MRTVLNIYLWYFGHSINYYDPCTVPEPYQTGPLTNYIWAKVAGVWSDVAPFTLPSDLPR